MINSITIKAGPKVITLSGFNLIVKLNFSQKRASIDWQATYMLGLR